MSSAVEINRIISNLTSSRIKDRNEALNELSSIANNISLVSSWKEKMHTRIIEGLLSSIGIDKRLFSKPKQVSAISQRMSQASFLIRSLVEKALQLRKFKYKSVENLLLGMINAVSDSKTSENGLCTPIAIDFLKVIRIIVETEAHLDHISPKLWGRLVNFIIHTVELHITELSKVSFNSSSSTYSFSSAEVKSEQSSSLFGLNSGTTFTSSQRNDKISNFEIVELLYILRQLISKPKGPFNDFSTDIWVLLKSLLNNSKESSISVPVIYSLYYLLYNLSLEDIELNHILVIETVKWITENWTTRNKTLKDIYLQFLIIGMPFFSISQFPKLTENYSFGEEIEILTDLIRALIKDLMTMNSKEMINIENLQFHYDSNIEHNHNFFRLPSCQLQSGNKQTFAKLSLAQIIIRLYFTLKKLAYKAENINDEEDHSLRPDKKRRLDDSKDYINIIFRSESPISLFSQAVVNPDPKFRSLFLQILAFDIQLESYQSNELELLKALKYGMEMDEYNSQWSLFVITCLIIGTNSDKCLKQQEFVPYLTSIVKFAIPHLKNNFHCKISCFTIINILRSPIAHLGSLLPSIDHILDIPEVNGPSIICNDSFQFWKVLVGVSGLPIVKLKRTSKKLFNWLYSKWQQLESKNVNNEFDIEHFINFWSWLSNSSKNQVLVSGSPFRLEKNVNGFSCFQPAFLFTKDGEPCLSYLLLKPDIEGFTVRSVNEVVLPTNYVNYEDIKEFKMKVIESAEKVALDARAETETDIDSSKKSINLNLLRWAILCAYIANEFDALTSSQIGVPSKINDVHYTSLYSQSEILFCLYLKRFPPTTAETSSSLEEEINLLISLYRINIYNTDKFTGVVGNLKKVIECATKLIKKTKSSQKDLEVDDGFGTVRKTAKVASIKMANCYLSSVSMMNTTLLHTIFKSIISVHLILDKKNYNNAIRGLIQFINVLEPNQFIMILPQFIQFLSKVDMKTIYTSIIGEIIRLVGSHLLADYDWERSVISMTECAQLLSILSPVWLNNTYDLIQKDALDVCSWLISLFKKDLIQSDFYFMKSFVHLLLQLMNKFDRKDIEDLTVNDITTQFHNILSSATNMLLFDISNNTDDLFDNIEPSNHLKIYEGVRGELRLSLPQSEVPAIGCYFLANIGASSYSNMVKCFFDLLESAREPNIKPYSRTCIDIIGKSLDKDMKSPQLFPRYSIEVLSLWVLNFIPISEFPFDLVIEENENSIDYFYKLYGEDCVSLAITNQEEKLILSIAKSRKITVTQLILKHFPIIVAIGLAINEKISFDIIRYLKNTLGEGLYVQSIKDNWNMIFYRLISYSDLSSIGVILTHVMSLSEDMYQHLSAMGMNEFLENLNPPFNPTINFSKLTMSLFNFYSDPPANWTQLLEGAQSLFICKKILKDIQTSSHTSEMIMNIRRLKLTISLSTETFTSGFSLVSIIDCIVPFLIPELSEEVSPLLVYLLQGGDMYLRSDSIIYIRTFVAIHHRIILFPSDEMLGQSKYKSLLSWMKESLESIMASKSISKSFISSRRLLETLSDSILERNGISLEQKDVEQILLNKDKIYDSSCYESLIKILSYYLETYPEFEKDLNNCIKPKKEVCQTLLRLDIKHLKGISVWKLRYIGSYYSLYGPITFEPKKEWEYNPVTNYTSNSKKVSRYTPMIKVFEEIEKFLHTSDSIIASEVYSAISCLFTVLPELGNDISNTVKVPFGEDILNSLCHFKDTSLIFPVSQANGFLRGFMDNKDTPNLIDDEWLYQLCAALVGELAQVFPPFGYLSGILRSIVRLKEVIFPYICYSYFSIVSGEHDELGEIFRQSLATPKRKAIHRILLQAYLLLNSESSHYLNITQEERWMDIDVSDTFEYMLNAHMPLTALILFEYEYCGKDNNAMNDDSIVSTLKSIYSQIRDPDVIYGLPVVPSLLNTLQMPDYAKRGSNRKLMFELSNFDSSIFSKNNYSDELLKSLADSGMSRVSMALSESELFYSSEGSQTFRNQDFNVYKWAWNLGQWDLPLPSSPQTTDGILFKTFKSIHDGREEGFVFKECLADLASIIDINNEEEQVNILETSAILHEVESIVKEKSIIGSCHNKWIDYQIPECWKYNANFCDFEDILLSRKVIFDILYKLDQGDPKLKNTVSSLGPDMLLECCKASINYAHFARDNDELQKATNALVLINKISNQIDKSNKVTSIIPRLTLIESAETLWKLEDQSIPIAMYNEAIKQSCSDLKNENSFLTVPSILYAQLAEWLSESRQEEPDIIMNQYLEKSASYLSDMPSSDNITSSKVYHTFAIFCCKQFRLIQNDDQINKLNEQKSHKREEILDYRMLIKKINKDNAGSQKSRAAAIKEAEHRAKRLRMLYERDKVEVERLVKIKLSFITKSIVYFLKSLSTADTYDNDVSLFVTLWLSNSDNSEVNQSVSENIEGVPTRKFIPWINQLSSRLLQDNTTFQKNLMELIVSICIHHPYHSLYQIENLRMYQAVETDSTIDSRIQASEVVCNTLRQNATYDKEFYSPINQFCIRASEISQVDGKTFGTSKIRVDSVGGSWWASKIKTLNIPPPTMNIPVRHDCNYKDNIPIMLRFDPYLSIAPSGLSRPKIMACLTADGSKYKMLMKGGNDDLRQDAIMEQVFQQVDRFFLGNKLSRSRNLKIRTYKVIPLGPNAGVIEFVQNSIALYDFLGPAHPKYYPDDYNIRKAKDMLKSHKKNERYDNYMDITKSLHPVMRHFFFERYKSPDDWFERRQSYTRGTATISILGYVLGLGDRHCNNILLDENNGDPIHIDLGVAFDQGKLLPLPEVVPFRLTRDIVDGMGITGVEGTFRRCCEITLKLLREREEDIIGILDVLRYDPLYSWTLSPLKRRKIQENDQGKTAIQDSAEQTGTESDTALEGVKMKLSKKLKVEAVVRQLIQEATDARRLCCLFNGWCPFY